MRSIVHRELGNPAQVLRLGQAPVPALASHQVRVRTTYTPIHPGDLLADYYGPSRVTEAVTHVSKPGKIGAVLLDFTEKREGK